VCVCVSSRKEKGIHRIQNRNQQAYICNLANHWFTLRKFSESYRWYNLDSMQPNPTYLGENYLAMMLHQIEGEGYSIFAVRGKLDDSTADRKARALLKPTQNDGVVEGKPLPDVIPFSGQGYSLSGPSKIEEDEEDEDEMLAKAIQASMEVKAAAPKDDMDEIRRKRLARFGG
jgi:ataxin-3